MPRFGDLRRPISVSSSAASRRIHFSRGDRMNQPDLVLLGKAPQLALEGGEAAGLDLDQQPARRGRCCRRGRCRRHSRPPAPRAGRREGRTTASPRRGASAPGGCRYVRTRKFPARWLARVGRDAVGGAAFGRGCRGLQMYRWPEGAATGFGSYLWSLGQGQWRGGDLHTNTAVSPGVEICGLLL